MRVPTRVLLRGLARRAARGKGGGEGGPPIATLRDVRKVLPGGRVLLSGVSLKLHEGAKVGVLGPNGAGKSSLLRLLAGRDAEHEGEAWTSATCRVGMLEQEPQLDDERSVMENILDGVPEQRDALARFDAVNAAIEVAASAGASDGADKAKTDGLPDDLVDVDLDDLITEQAALAETIDDLDCWQLTSQVAETMRALNCPPADMMPATLSGGQRRRVALCRLIVSAPDMLLLDEPTNHLDAASVAWLEGWLGSHAGTVVAVTHDRYFLDNVARMIVDIDGGAVRGFRGNYTAWLKLKAERSRVAEKASDARAKRMQAELEWIRSTPKGGRGASRARAREYEKLVADADASRDAERVQSGAIAIVPGPRLGNLVLVADGVTKEISPRSAPRSAPRCPSSIHPLPQGYDGRVLFRDLSFELPPGGILGVIGPNGVGKSSLVRLIAGEETPDEGTIRVGPTVTLGYVNQNRTGLDPKKTVYEEIAQGRETISLGGGRDVATRAYVASFNLRGQMQEKLVGALSGGERGRVHLAKTLLDGCNLLILDEPSNDLDVDTLRSLEEALHDFAGSALVVSHDRWFLDRVCTHTLAFEQSGQVEFFEGTVTDYYAWCKRRRSEESQQDGAKRVGRRQQSQRR